MAPGSKKMWCGEAPKVELEIDDNFSFLLSVTLTVNTKNTKLHLQTEGGKLKYPTLEEALVGTFIGSLDAAGILIPYPGVQEMFKGNFKRLGDEEVHDEE